MFPNGGLFSCSVIYLFIFSTAHTKKLKHLGASYDENIVIYDFKVDTMVVYKLTFTVKTCIPLHMNPLDK